MRPHLSGEVVLPWLSLGSAHWGLLGCGLGMFWGFTVRAQGLGMLGWFKARFVGFGV